MIQEPHGFVLLVFIERHWKEILWWLPHWCCCLNLRKSSLPAKLLEISSSPVVWWRLPSRRPTTRRVFPTFFIRLKWSTTLRSTKGWTTTRFTATSPERTGIFGFFALELEKTLLTTWTQKNLRNQNLLVMIHELNWTIISAVTWSPVQSQWNYILRRNLFWIRRLQKPGANPKKYIEISNIFSAFLIMVGAGLWGMVTCAVNYTTYTDAVGWNWRLCGLLRSHERFDHTKFVLF